MISRFSDWAFHYSYTRHLLPPPSKNICKDYYHAVQKSHLVRDLEERGDGRNLDSKSVGKKLLRWQPAMQYSALLSMDGWKKTIDTLLQDPTLWLALLNDSTCKIRFEMWTEIEFCSSGFLFLEVKPYFWYSLFTKGNKNKCTLPIGLRVTWSQKSMGLP